MGLIFRNRVSLSFNMGNGQSVETPRRAPNRLSKPRTNNSNSTTNLLNLKSAGPPSRRDSELKNGASRYTAVPADAVVGEENERRESRQKKRMSMFRSKSAQPKAEPLQINTGVDIEFLERSPVDNWSTRGSITHESPDQPYFAAPEERQDSQTSFTLSANNLQSSASSNCSNVPPACPVRSTPSSTVPRCRSTISAARSVGRV